MDKTLELSWPYVAGFWDADGHFSIYRSPKYPSWTPSINAGVTQGGGQERILFTIQDFLFKKGVKSSVREAKKKGSQFINRMPCFELEVLSGRDNMEKFLRLIVPHLRLKSSKAKEALKVVSESKNYKRVSAVEEMKILGLRKSGKSKAYIGRYLGRSHATVRRVLEVVG